LTKESKRIYRGVNRIFKWSEPVEKGKKKHSSVSEVSEVSEDSKIKLDQ
jgi:CPA2 family monovalent cation:H+ antiporter-2